MDSKLDIERDKYLEWKERQYYAMRDYCDGCCDEHNENCLYYDSEEESWDFELCFKEREGI